MYMISKIISKTQNMDKILMSKVLYLLKVKVIQNPESFTDM